MVVNVNGWGTGQMYDVDTKRFALTCEDTEDKDDRLETENEGCNWPTRLTWKNGKWSLKRVGCRRITCSE